MKKERASEAEIRVVDDDAPEAVEVVRLGEPGGVVRLGAAPRAVAAEPKRLEFVERPAYDARSQEPGIEEILDVAESDGVRMEDRWGGEAKRWMVVPWGWFVLAAVPLLGLVTWSLHQLVENRGAAAEATTRAEEIERAELQRTAQAERLCQRLQARVTAYLAAGSVEELAQHARHPERVLPLMRGWYASRPLQPAHFERFMAFQPLTIERRPFWAARAAVAGGAPRTLLLEQTEDDDGRVDWETDVCYQPMPWNDYIGRRPTGGFGFRVNVAPDSFYSHEFADERQYRCFRLTALGSDEHLFGYVRRGSRQEQAIVEALGGGARPASMLLELMHVPDSRAARSVVISEVISPRWSLVESAER